MKRITAIMFAAGSVSASAQEIVTVTTLNDVSDTNLATVLPADLPGPDGKISFREAVAATNNAAGPQTVKFAIPETEWWLRTELALLRLEDGPFMITDDFTTLDFASQADFTGDTNPNGGEVGIYSFDFNGMGHAAIFIFGSNTTVIGLGPVLQRRISISVDGGNFNRFIGNTTTGIELDPFSGTTTGNIIGGLLPGEGNTLDMVNIHCGANDNVVIGNILKEVNVVGSQYCDEGTRYPRNNRIGGPTPEERNIISGFGGRSSEGTPSGDGVLVAYAKNTLVEGNYIGVSPDGMSRVSQLGTSGVRVNEAIDTIIRGNLISGIRAFGTNHSAGEVFGQAILVTAINGHTYRTTIQGNIIGTDATGENPIVTHDGIVVAPLTTRFFVYDTIIGGTGQGQANTIAYTELSGVTVATTVDSATILGNSIYGHDGLGIDLFAGFPGSGGVTVNDLGDTDAGGNGLQNYPELSAVTVDGALMTITGSLNSQPNSAYHIELFGNIDCDQSGFGEGRFYLGSLELTTNTAGNASINTTLNAAPTGVEFVTATATNIVSGATSEFSACFGMPAVASCAADVNQDGVLSPADFTAWINAFNNTLPECDQNNDGSCAAADFTAWIANYNAGC